MPLLRLAVWNSVSSRNLESQHGKSNRHVRRKQIIMAEPEIIGPNDELSIASIGSMDAQTKSEINLQVEFAMKHPRSIEVVRKELESLVTLNQSIAEESFYTLKRKDKSGNVKLIQGPSIRFAEVLCYVWGHVRWAKQISDVDAEFVTGEGIFMDLQRNIVGKIKTKRRITDSGGRRYNADMIQTTGNAAASLAYRNAVTGSIPQALWKDVLEKAKVVAVGGTQSIAEKRTAALQYGAKIGVSAEQIFATLGVQGVNDLGIEELIALKGLFNSLKDGESTVEEAFGDPYEKEVTALMDQLQWPKGRRDMAFLNYRGKSVELLAFLRKQAEPLNVGQDKEKSGEQSATGEAEKGAKSTPRGRVAKEKEKAEPSKEADTSPDPTVPVEDAPQDEPVAEDKPTPEPESKQVEKASETKAKTLPPSVDANFLF